MCCCRIAKLLLFATLVPESVPALPADGTAAYVRRLWRHPVTHMPCEVQLIMGKTIERQLVGRAGRVGVGVGAACTNGTEACSTAGDGGCLCS